MIWSYSRLNAYENCPYQWLMTYILKVKGKNKFFAEYGSLMHELLQEFYSGKSDKDDLLWEFVDYYIKYLKNKAPTINISDSYFEKGRQYLASLTTPCRDILAVEKNFSFTFADHPFTAFIDLISKDKDGNVYITDHKSRELKPRSGKNKPTKSDEELDKYYRQLYVYSAAYKSEYGSFPDYLEFNTFKNGCAICEPFNIDRFNEVETWARNLIEKITQTNIWDASLNFWFCKHLCDVSLECEYEEYL